MARQPEAAMVGPSQVEAEPVGLFHGKRLANRAAKLSGRWLSRNEKMRADPRTGPMIDRLEFHRGIEMKMREIGFPILGAPFESHCIALLMAKDPTMGVKAAANEVLRSFWDLCSEAISLHVGRSANDVTRYNARLFLGALDSQEPEYINFRNAASDALIKHGLSFFPAIVDPANEEMVAFRRLSLNGSVVPAESISADFFVENASGRIRDIVCAELVFNGSREGFSRQPISPPRSIAALNGMQVFFSVLLGGPEDDILLY